MPCTGSWTALGTVGHWGHLHRRKNRYEAVVTLGAQDGVWKIVGLDLLDEQRIDQSPATTTDTAAVDQRVDAAGAGR